ncbi:hypothetical protein HOLleu_21522 [Holothuria leucospilota]|uniref:EGF-like domain-containing protein n=1 Tax=Holothuria leucospilota TaxID=206669 RepID=A0A9Q1BXM6_HOLLE|nr:hypothetical protein HOLleu_21522 [Holothuria leucospilota]
MKLFLLKIAAAALIIPTVTQGQSATISCVSCSSIIFQDVGFTDLELFQDEACEHGIGPVDVCPSGYVCASIIGVETQNIAGYGETNFHVVIRGCEIATFFDISQAASGCVPADQHEDFLGTDASDPDVQFVRFEGDICYCSEDTCNDVMAPPIHRPALPHTPPPNAPGLQCRFCSHVEFHDDVLKDPTITNFDCEDGLLTSEDVYYITCPAGSVCLNIRGQMTYSSLGFDVAADVHDRRCFFVDDVMDAESGCVDQDDISDYQTDYYSYFDDVIFQGGACYCSRDLCDCDPDVCLESSTFTCADHAFCTGLHEICVDGFFRPRCECEEGYGFDERFQCQQVAKSCITCVSRHFLGDFTSGTLSEDLECEAGRGAEYSCADDSVCATLVGTETNWYEGYGPVQSRIVHRGCEKRALFDEFSPCLSDPLSGNIFMIDNEYPRVNFTGEACYCSENNCNTELQEIERIIRPPIPDGDARGLQCTVCFSRHPLSPAEESNVSLDRACVEGDHTHPDVYYVTCPSDHSCLKVLGVFRFFLGAAFGEYLTVERRCIPNTYTMGGDSGCIAMDEVRDNLEEDYSSYYFYFDAIEIEAPACYCSTDFCDCDVTSCKTDTDKDETCESEGVCDKPHEKCHDTTTAGPVCFCEVGYSYDENRNCVPDADLTCENEGMCDEPNEVCLDMPNGPTCVCEDGYERNDEGECEHTTPTCNDGDLCSQPNEHCEDISNTPTCVCDTGYEYNTRRNCVRGFTCRTKECTIANSECVDSKDGPRCVCKQNYVMGPDGNRCNVRNTNQDENKNDGSKGSTNVQLSYMMFWILVVTGVILTRE